MTGRIYKQLCNLGGGVSAKTGGLGPIFEMCLNKIVTSISDVMTADFCITSLVTPCIRHCLRYLFNSWEGVRLFQLIFRRLLELLRQLRIMNKGMSIICWMIIGRETWKYSVSNLFHCDFYYYKARPNECYVCLRWSNLKSACILSAILLSNLNFDGFFSLCCMPSVDTILVAVLRDIRPFRQCCCPNLVQQVMLHQPLHLLVCQLRDSKLIAVNNVLPLRLPRKEERLKFYNEPYLTCIGPCIILITEE